MNVAHVSTISPAVLRRSGEVFRDLLALLAGRGWKTGRKRQDEHCACLIAFEAAATLVRDPAFTDEQRAALSEAAKVVLSRMGQID